MKNKKLVVTVVALVVAGFVVAGCETMGQSAGLGGVIGAGTGALIGSASGHAGEGALIGGAVGIVAGKKGWAVQGDQTIIYYAQNAPLATVVLQDCTVNASSSIRLLKTYLCDSDTVLVDGQECSIMSLTWASAP